MKQLEINPNELLSSGHRIIHNLHILRIYFNVYSRGCDVAIPPVPVVRVEKVLANLNKEIKELFEEYLKERPEVKYVLLDGTHKTTAAALNHKKCKVIVVEDDKDVKELIALESSGEIFQHIIGDSAADILANIKRHLEEKKLFQTVEEKTKYFVDSKAVPQYVIDKYMKGN